MNLYRLAVFIVSLIALPSIAQVTADNSNFWPVYRDNQTGFRISYPPTWNMAPTKGPNVRFSVNPPIGPGNCNVVARQNRQFDNKSQIALNREIGSLSLDQASWADYVGIPPSQLSVFETYQIHIHDVLALVGVIEARLENLQGQFTRKQIVAMMFTPGLMWSLNCGASSFDADIARLRFLELRPEFNKIFGSFSFVGFQSYAR